MKDDILEFGKWDFVTKLVFDNTLRASLIKYLNQKNCELDSYLSEGQFADLAF